jgi:hypothetical protein
MWLYAVLSYVKVKTKLQRGIGGKYDRGSICMDNR